MTKPTEQDLHQLQQWDAEYNNNVAIRRDGPLPIKEYETPDPLPNPAAYDRCLAWRNDGPGASWILYVSNGVEWLAVNAPSDSNAVWTTASTDAFGRTIKKAQIEFGSLPVSGSSSIAHGLPDIDISNGGFLKVSGMASDTSQMIAFPDARAKITVDATNITVEVTEDLAAYYAWIEIEYVENP